MLNVTERAKEKLQEKLFEMTSDPEKSIRMIFSPSSPNKLDFILDDEDEGDQVVKNDRGQKVLLVGPDLVSALKDMLIDYQETSQGTGFTLSEFGHLN